MLFDTLRRKNQAEQEEREWNANRPADYVSRNKDAMDSLTGQIGSGFDWDTGSKAYQQYRAQAQANAAASAENAQANAEMLAGGYGSSYADSVAKQGQQQALSGIDNAVPGLRGQALSEYQNQQNDLLSALSGMANTEALDRSAYGSNFANYTAWQNFLANQSEQARNENDNYWNNLWNTVKNIGSAALTAYDRYVRKRNGEVLLVVVRKPSFLTFSFRQCRIYPPFLQVSEQGRRRKRHDFQLLETRLRKGLLAKRERNGAHVRCLFLYAFQKIRHTVRCIEVRSQCDDVAALAECKIIPLVPLGIHLERCFGFFPERRFVPKIDALPLHRAISQAVKILFQPDLFCCLYIHK